MDDTRVCGQARRIRGRNRARARRFAGADPRPGEPARPERLIQAMRYATLGGGKRLRPFLTVETARALGRQDKGPRRAGRGDRMRSRLFVDSRRSPGDGRRRPEARAADHPSRLRRSDGDSRRRRAAGAGVRDPGRSGDRSKSPKCAPSFAPASRAPPVSPAWSAGRCSTSTPKERRRRFRSRRSPACRR